MKFQCDVCIKEEATLFCSADEAALCFCCDRKVHEANKLAGKHQRFSLLHPNSNEVPRCDVCQEKRAFLFCQEDRAILCNDCDISIHTINDLTEKHNRFLLSGVRLSLTPNSLPESIPNKYETSESQRDKKTTSTKPFMIPPTATPKINSTEEIFASSISDYLIKTLPGWHVEDLLDSPVSDDFNQRDELVPFAESDIQSNNPCLERLPIWVPQVPQISSSSFTGSVPVMIDQYSHEIKNLKEMNRMKEYNIGHWVDDGFTVPQISLNSCKRQRTIW